MSPKDDYEVGEKLREKQKINNFYINVNTLTINQDFYVGEIKEIMN